MIQSIKPEVRAVQTQRSEVPAPALTSTMGMRQLKRDELRAVAGGPIIQNRTK